MAIQDGRGASPDPQREDMMKKARFFASLLSLVLVTGCSAVRLSLDYDPAADISGWRTFAWCIAAWKQTGDYRIDNPLLEERIRSAVTAELVSFGYVPLHEGEPDFRVDFKIALSPGFDVDVTPSGAVHGRLHRWHTFKVRPFEEQTIVIDIRDALSDRLVWRGAGTWRFRGDLTPEETTSRINRIVREILERFPPP